MCHPRLPLVAGLDSERPAVHVWDCDAGQLHALETIGAESTAYGAALRWDRWKRTPAMAWHPDQPLLMVSDGSGLARWTPDGLAEVDEVPPTVSYRSLAFTPDGRTLWAVPSSKAGPGAGEFSDILDVDSGIVGTGPGWDTGVAAHPAGGLMATLYSEQGGTLGLFARVDDETAPATMRILRRALILDADGYESPIFSADGRHLAVRGNNYDNSLDVFAFPTLRRVLKTTLGNGSTSRRWSRHNIAFGAQPGVLWLGTPTGILVELDLDEPHVVEHDVLDGHRVTALDTTPAGDLVVAHADGDLVLLSVAAGPANTQAPDDAAVRTTVRAFLDATSEVPDDGDLYEHVVLTDGVRDWGSDDLETVTTATATDPTWLQLQAAINDARGRNG